MKTTEYFARLGAQNLRRAVGNIDGHERKILARAAQLHKEHGIEITRARQIADCTNEQWDRFLHLFTTERMQIDDASRISRYDLAKQQRVFELQKNNQLNLTDAERISGYSTEKQQEILQFIDKYKIKSTYKGNIAEKILAVLQPTNQVTSIDLRSYYIGHKGAIALAEALKDPNCKVTSIGLEHTQIGFEGASALAEALKHPNCKVTSINLQSNEIGYQGAIALAESLKNPNCKVTSIYIEGNQIGNQGAIALAEALKHPNCKVTSINLWYNQIGNQGASALAEALKDPNCKVKSINLGVNQIGHQGSIALSEALKDPNCKVTSINLSSNPNGKEVAIALAESLKDSNCKVTSIDLGGNQIGKEGVIALSKSLKNPNCKVTSINLGSNQISKEDTIALAESLKDPNCKVTSINLRYNQIDNEGAIALAEALKNPNCKVTSIDLEHNPIGNQGAITLAEALKHPNCKVTSISFWDNHIDQKILNQIDAQLRINKARAEEEQKKQAAQNTTQSPATKSPATQEEEQKKESAAKAGEDLGSVKAAANVFAADILPTKPSTKSADLEEISDAVLEEILRDFTDAEILQLVGAELQEQQLSAKKAAEELAKKQETLKQEASRQEQLKQQQEAEKLNRQIAEVVLHNQDAAVDFARIVELEKIVQNTADLSAANQQKIAQAQNELAEIDAKYKLSAADRAEIDHIAHNPKLQQYYQRAQRAVNEVFAAAAIMSSGEFAQESSDRAKFLSQLSGIASSVPFAASVLSIASQVAEQVDGSVSVGKLIKIQNLNPSGNSLDAAIFAEKLARRLAITNEAEIVRSDSEQGKISGILDFFAQAQENLTKVARKQVGKVSENFALGYFGEELTPSEVVALDDSRKAVDFVTAKKVEDTKFWGAEISRGNQDLVVDQITQAVLQKTPVKMAMKMAVKVPAQVAVTTTQKLPIPSQPVAAAVVNMPPAPPQQNNNADLMEMIKQMQEQNRQMQAQMAEQAKQNQELRQRVEAQEKTIETLKAERTDSQSSKSTTSDVSFGKAGLLQKQVQDLASDRQSENASALSISEQRRLAELETQVSLLSTCYNFAPENEPQAEKSRLGSFLPL